MSEPFPHTGSMNSVLPVLLGSASTLSVVTLMLLFTGNLWAMALTATAALVLAGVAIPTLAQHEAADVI